MTGSCGLISGRVYGELARTYNSTLGDTSAVRCSFALGLSVKVGKVGEEWQGGGRGMRHLAGNLCLHGLLLDRSYHWVRMTAGMYWTVGTPDRFTEGCVCGYQWMEATHLTLPPMMVLEPFIDSP